MKKQAPGRPERPDKGPEEIDDVEDVSGGNCIPSPDLVPTDDPFRDWTDPLGDAKKLEL